MAEFGTSTPEEPRASASGGVLASLRGLAGGLLHAAHQRLDLFALELREEKLRATQLFIWLSAAVFAGALAVTFASVTLVYLFWETARLAVLIGLTVFYAAGCYVAVRGYRRCAGRHPKPFEGTLAELRSDRACIRPDN